MPCLRRRKAPGGSRRNLETGTRNEESRIGRKERTSGLFAPVLSVWPVCPVRTGVLMRFANQVAFITGASSGIGWALARELAGQKCHVGLIARRKGQLDKLADEIRQAGGTA